MDKNRLLTFLLTILIFVFVLNPLGVYLYLKFWNVPGKPEDIKKSEQAGEEIYNRMFSVEDKDNGWIDYVKAYKSLDLRMVEGNSKHVTIQTWVTVGMDENQKKIKEKFLDKNKEAIQLALNGAKKKHVAILSELPQKQLNPSQSKEFADNVKTNTILPYFLILAADREMEKGDFQKAAETYMSVVSMGRGFDPEGWGIAHRTSVMHIVTGRLVKLINTIPDKDNAVKDIFEEMKRIKSDFPDLKACLVLNNYLAQQTGRWRRVIFRKLQKHICLL